MSRSSGDIDNVHYASCGNAMFSLHHDVVAHQIATR